MFFFFFFSYAKQHYPFIHVWHVHFHSILGHLYLSLASGTCTTSTGRLRLQVDLEFGSNVIQRPVDPMRGKPPRRVGCRTSHHASPWVYVPLSLFPFPLLSLFTACSLQISLSLSLTHAIFPAFRWPSVVEKIQVIYAFHLSHSPVCPLKPLVCCEMCELWETSQDDGW